MKNLLLQLKIWKDQKGQDLIEYALMAGFVAVAAGATDLWGNPLTRRARSRPNDGSKAYAFFGRFAPYFERACLRSLTPWRSSEPRTMW